MDDLPLLELFTRLREAGLPLGIKDYESALQALQGGYGLPNHAALARLCQTLWVRSADERQLFNYYFEQVIGIRSNADLKIPAAETDPANSAIVPSPGSLKERLKERWVKDCLVLVAGVGLVSVVIFTVVRWNPPKTTVKAPAALPSVSIPKPSVSVSVQPTKPIQPATPFNQNFQMAQVGLFLALMLGAGLIGAGIVWLLRHYQVIEQLQRRRQPVAPPLTSTNNAKSVPELLRDVEDKVQVAQVVRQIANPAGRSKHDRFLLTGDYLPVTQRQMKQSWRHLRRMVREGMATELDVEGTVHRIAQDGMLLDPVLVPSRRNRTELVLLIDQDGSMVPFHSLSARLVETAMRGGRLGRAGAYYFHNCPMGHLYHDPLHQAGDPIEAVLRGLRRDRTVVLIFSDAGAARGGLNLERAELTTDFLQPLKQRARYVAWLNPMPKSRWATSTAREIAQHVPMFEATRSGLDEAIEALRGRHQPFATVLEGVK